MAVSIGILIIGSLHWDDKEHRQSWRNIRLEMDKAVRVRAPIRYGRQSRTRGDTYTMVFSEELDRSKDKLGYAMMCPCRKTVQSPNDLIEEAEALWCAERPPDSSHGDISAGWGCVTIIQNPDRPLASAILRAWTDRVASERSYGRLCHSNDEHPVVEATGLMNISWPTDAPGHYSALLATATDPTLAEGQYPSADQIAAAWNTVEGRKHRDYFTNNRKHGIHTFQDEQISSGLGDVSA